MKKRIYNILFVAAFGCLFFACEKEHFNPDDAENIVDLGGGRWSEGPIDTWIKGNLTGPYNIDVKYKWDAFEDISTISYIVVPPKEEHIIPILTAIKKTWIDIYVEEGTAAFFNTISPKIIYMIGSPAVEESGALRLGVAEGGKKIILLAINLTKMKGMADYQPSSDTSWAKEMFLTVHHEFGHILHQNKMYPIEFKNISPQLITSNWADYSPAQALRDGFISAYAMNTNDDDFVEMIARLLVNGQDWFEEQLASIPEGVSDRGTTREQAISKLRTKESMIVNYYKQSWNIDFRELQAKVRASVEDLLY